MGRKMVPTHLKVIAGNPGNRKLNKKEPKPGRALKRRPRWFDARHCKEWDEVLAEVPKGMLRHIDGDALEAFIVARLQFRDATIAMRGEPLVVIGDKMDRVNPLLTTQHKAMLLLLKAASDLGFTPSSRAKVQTVDGLEDEEDLDNPFSIGRKQA